MSLQQAVKQTDALQYDAALLQACKQGTCGNASCQHKLQNLPPEVTYHTGIESGVNTLIQGTLPLKQESEDASCCRPGTHPKEHN
jgi:hypothetical protein